MDEQTTSTDEQTLPPVADEGVTKDNATDKVTNNESIDEQQMSPSDFELSEVDDKTKVRQANIAKYKAQVENGEITMDEIPHQWIRNEIESTFESEGEEELLSKLEKKIEGKKIVKAAQEQINSFVKDNPEWIKSNGRKFKEALIEAANDGTALKSRFSAAIGKLALEGIYVDPKAIAEAQRKGRREAGQSIPTSKGDTKSQDKESTIETRAAENFSSIISSQGFDGSKKKF